KTRFAEALYAADEAGAAERYLLKRLGEPADVAAAVAYLASGDASWTTGQTLVLDGGLVTTF
ncbi:MAG TPA: SDR family oxidoreductase, partial [Jatrophihabitans sp.]|nr:SDR family oxidoreductase [Jatrophihabitans sp.]